MKKHIFWIVPGVLLVFVALISESANYFNRTLFNIRHVISFGLIVYVLLASLYLVYRFFITRYVRKRNIKIALIAILSTVGIVVTITVSTLQISYIEEYETPHLESCIYYDHFGNVIYKSLIDECPELVIVDNEYPNVTYQISEHYQGQIFTSYTYGDFGHMPIMGDSFIDTTIKIEYLGTYIKSFEYTLYNTNHDRTKRVGVNEEYGFYEYEMEITDDIWGIVGYMYNYKMELDFETSNQVTATYTSKEAFLEFDDLIVEFPSFDEIDGESKTYIATKERQVHPLDPYYVTYGEVTYDEEGNANEDMFGYGQYLSINEPVVGIDFYENGVISHTYTDYSFMHNSLTIKSSEMQFQSTGVERMFNQRLLNFSSNPNELYDGSTEEELITSDIQFLNNFTASISLCSAGKCDVDNSIKVINDQVFVYDNDYYTRFVKTDYGLKAEKYNKKEFRIESIFNPNWHYSSNTKSIGLIQDSGVKEVPNLYDFKTMMMYPGYLKDYHFYQHNHLVEFVFIDDYDAIGDKNPN